MASSSFRLESLASLRDRHLRMQRLTRCKSLLTQSSDLVRVMRIKRTCNASCHHIILCKLLGIAAMLVDPIENPRRRTRGPQLESIGGERCDTRRYAFQIHVSDRKVMIPSGRRMKKEYHRSVPDYYSWFQPIDSR
jgi:hypothetical protein